MRERRHFSIKSRIGSKDEQTFMYEEMHIVISLTNDIKVIKKEGGWGEQWKRNGCNHPKNCCCWLWNLLL